MNEAESNKLAALRKWAEAIRGRHDLEIPDVPPEDVGWLFHELRTHQIELELQNEELRRTQEELIESRDRYSDLYDFAPVGYLTISEKGLITEANLTAAELLAVERASLSGQRLSAFVLKEDQDIYYRHQRQLLEIQEKQTCDLRMQKGNSEAFWAKLESVVVDDPGQGVVRLRTTITDVSELKRAEAALRQAHDELEEQVKERTAELTTANAQLREEIVQRERIEKRSLQLQTDLAHAGRLTTMGELASSLAHELNQPLTAIAVRADASVHQMSAEREQIVEDLRRSLRFIEDQALRGGELIRRMRGFVKKTGPRKTIFHAAEAIDEIVPLVAGNLRKSGITSSIHVEPSLPAIVADTIQIQQVLLNLIQNAIEAMECVEYEDHHVEIRARRENESIKIAVSDTGQGLPDEGDAHVQDLFRAFCTTKAEGIGIGLAISRSIVEAHGGRLDAQPNPDRGATFTFTLPIEESRAEPEP